MLAMRERLAVDAERLATQKVPPSRRQVNWALAPAWAPNLLADALDVAQVVREGPGEVAETWAPVCPRCPRPHPEWVGNVCLTWQRRTA